MRIPTQHKVAISGDGKDQSFHFDRVFDPSETQDAVAEEV